MSHFEFKSGTKKGRNQYVGSWSEIVSKAINLPFTADSIITVLKLGENPNEFKITHQDIAHWCSEFHLTMVGVNQNNTMNIATDVAADVDAQWEMYLANTFTLDELKQLDFSQVKMPLEWFSDWIKQIENT